MNCKLRDSLWVAVVLVAIGAISNRDYDDAVAQETQRRPASSAPLPDSRCRANDILGRPLVSSYYARSDSIQTLHCDYAKRIPPP